MKTLDSRISRAHADVEEAPFTVPDSLPWNLVEKHRRYVSDWTDDIVKINVAHFQEMKPRYRYYELGTIQLSGKGGLSPFQTNIALSDFPHFVITLKLGINAAITKHDRGATETGLVSLLGTAQRFFVWTLRQGVHRISSLGVADFDNLATDLANRGWWDILDYAGALRMLLADASRDPSIAAELRGMSKHTRYTPINMQALQRYIGMPLSAPFVPRWFADGLDQIWGVTSPQSRKRVELPRPSRSALINSLTAINLLCLHPNGFDSPPFHPYPNRDSIADQLLPNAPKGRTANLNLDDAVRIFQEALRWLYDYGPGIIELLNLLRSTLEKTSEMPNDRRVREVTRRLRDAYPDLRRRYNFPHESLSHVKGDASVHGMLEVAYTSVFCLIALNHARRKNELIGQNVPHGLYFGCIRSVAGFGVDHRIEIYIEKTLQDYQEFWCNSIVVDAVHLLEEISQAFRPLNSPRKVFTKNRSDARSEKLFLLRTFTPAAFVAPAEQYDYKNMARQFFRLAGVSQEVLSHKSHPFRRFFALLYTNRYDNPILLALQQHLCHLSPDSTRIYLTDSPAREDSERIERLFATATQENDGVESAQFEVESEYFEQKLAQMLAGESIGGYFPRLVAKLLTRLASSAEFDRKNLHEAARILRERLEARGYRADVKSHGVCMAGTARHTRRHAHCFANEQLNPDQATPEICNGCVNLLTTEHYRQTWKQEHSWLLRRANDERIPIPIRQEAAASAKRHFEVMESERQIAERNQALFLSLMERWKVVADSSEAP